MPAVNWLYMQSCADGFYRLKLGEQAIELLLEKYDISARTDALSQNNRRRVCAYICQ